MFPKVKNWNVCSISLEVLHFSALQLFASNIDSKLVDGLPDMHMERNGILSIILLVLNFQKIPFVVLKLPLPKFLLI